MGNWVPHFRYWVAVRASNGGWVAERKTNSRFLARAFARQKASRGYDVKVEDKGVTDE